ncbi:uncharacterized protein LDX57_009339 [Aspergillus melleus]|uniref:uncharacterized protein n=1 Tax=Aspergillus melleus TaxID=138277 RepID=UPI001E8CE21D|nr:uncharacterized protein LDX57_009339 [Aspergillus melleus]KAH8431685.1 hypothetical protein LDX57_009339 [Aspergillus melleus]
MAREFDPDGDRTLGVITKPDLVDKGGEGKVIDLVEGREIQMKLGWIIVRNLGQKELEEGDVDRNVLEAELLSQRPWDTVPRDKFGIKALRTHLQKTVRSAISKKLRECQDALQALGADRETPEQQASFLFGIVSSFQEITSHALGSNYSIRDDFDQDEILRLATRVVNRNEMFSDNMARWGHEYEFETDDSQELNDFRVNNSIDNPTGGSLATRMLEDISGIEDILPQTVEVAQPVRNDIRSWIERQYRTSRGFEIGTFNSALLPTIMKKQSTKWTSIATGYIGDIITIVHGFILRALNLACADTRVCHNLLSRIMDKLLGKYQNAISQVQFLLFNECSIDRNARAP